MGRPEGPCLARKNDNTVRLSQGDLELCRDCEIYRFPYLAKGKAATRQSEMTSQKAAEKSEPTEVGSGSTTPATTAAKGKTATRQSEMTSRKAAEKPEPTEVGSGSTTPVPTVVVN